MFCRISEGTKSNLVSGLPPLLAVVCVTEWLSNVGVIFMNYIKWLTPELYVFAVFTPIDWRTCPFDKLFSSVDWSIKNNVFEYITNWGHSYRCFESSSKMTDWLFFTGAYYADISPCQCQPLALICLSNTGDWRTDWYCDLWHISDSHCP